MRISLLFAALLLSVISVTAAPVIETDVCVYGGTSGGVVAAVQAARQGKSVSLLVFGNHVGGMTSGGLGATDVGGHGTDYIQGVAREFYIRVNATYSAGATTPKFDKFEPKVAEAVFKAMLTDVGVVPRYQQHLASVTKAGQRITEIAMDDGTIYRAKMFIDASYEGDLMAQAGVTWTIGRESTAQYNESLNGIRGSTPAHQFSVNVDPYVTPGVPSSGLLPFVQAGPLGTPGDADSRVQSYNYRMCLTKTLANQIPIPAPAGYSESNYEVLGRLITAYIDAGTTPSMTTFMNVTSFTINGTDKTDINNNGAFSTDFLGMADNYATASYAQRALIEQQHKDYIQGFLYYLGHSTRVPLAVRNQMLAYGFCKDEFTDNGGFGALYVREARRMVSDYVMRQQNCQGTETVADSVGLGSYTMDAHNTRRIVQTVMVSGQPKDVLRNEGDVQQTIPAVYPISYRSLVPKVGECENLLVPWCLSASHMAFGSIRMEPVFMILSQSAGSAAVIAIDNDVPVQQVSYPKLALQLTVDGQALTNGSPATDGIVIDNADTTGITKIGNWVTSAASTGFYGADYWHDNATDKGLNSVRFTPNIPATGDYDVYIRYPSNPNRSTNVPVDVISASGTQTFTVNQVNNGGTWNFLQRATFNAGTNGSVLIRTTNTAVGTYVIADAVRFVSTTNGGPAVQIIASDAETREGAANPARFSVFRATSDTASPLVVNYTISGTATNGVDYNTLPGSVTVPAGSATAAISVQAIGDAIAEGTDTLTLTLAAGTGYNLGTVNAATMKILDRPVDDWRHANFTPAQLADPNVSGDLADADRDSLQTLAEYALGGDPNATTALPTPVNTGGYLTLTYARRKSATDVTINVEATHDLKNWTPLAPVEQVSIADAGAFELVTVRIATPISQDPQAFLRLKVTRP